MLMLFFMLKFVLVVDDDDDVDYINLDDLDVDVIFYVYDHVEM